MGPPFLPRFMMIPYCSENYVTLFFSFLLGLFFLIFVNYMTRLCDFSHLHLAATSG